MPTSQPVTTITKKPQRIHPPSPPFFFNRQLYVLQTDGSVLPALINAASLALVDAGVAMREPVAACSVALLDDQPVLVRAVCVFLLASVSVSVCVDTAVLFFDNAADTDISIRLTRASSSSYHTHTQLHTQISISNRT